MSDLISIVDVRNRVHLVKRDDYAAGVETMTTYYKSGKAIKDCTWRIRPASLSREQVASIAVKSRKHNFLDDRIASKFRGKGAATVAMF